MPFPWEMKWGESEAVPAKKGPQPSGAPWEMDWGKGKGEPSKEAPTPHTSGQGATESYLEKTFQVESGGDVNAKASTSTATGPFQFTEGTWKDVTKRMGVDYPLSDRTDMEKSREVMTRFTEDNRALLIDTLGREPEEHELYIAHFLGEKGGPAFLQADPSLPAKQVVSDEAFKANKSVFVEKGSGRLKTVGEVLQKFKARYDDPT